VARGIRLFLLWYQILGSNAVEEEHNIFKNLIRDWNKTFNGARPSGETNSADDLVPAGFYDLFRTRPGQCTMHLYWSMCNELFVLNI
jgi:hypothetical protein